MRVILLILLFFCSVSVEAAEQVPPVPPWHDAKSVIHECYSKWDFTLKIHGTYEQGYEQGYDDQYSDTFGQTDTSGIAGTESTTGLESGYTSGFRSGRVKGGYAGATLVIPLYSKKEKLASLEQKNLQVEHLADLYAEYESQRGITVALSEQVTVLKGVMLQNGAGAISEYFLMLQSLEQAKAQQTGAGRKIINLLELCGYVGRSRITGPRQAAHEENRSPSTGK